MIFFLLFVFKPILISHTTIPSKYKISKWLFYLWRELKSKSCWIMSLIGFFNIVRSLNSISHACLQTDLFSCELTVIFQFLDSLVQVACDLMLFLPQTYCMSCVVFKDGGWSAPSVAGCWDHQAFDSGWLGDRRAQQQVLQSHTWCVSFKKEVIAYM